MTTRATTILASLTIALAAASAPAAAQGVPGEMSFSARLHDGDGPIDGAVNLDVRIYDAPSGGSLMWEETHSGVAVSDGILFATLGATAQNELDGAVFDGRPMYLQVSVNGDVLSPRVPLQTVPYSVRAAVAASAERLGTLEPGDVALAGHDHAGAYLPVGASLLCGAGQKVTGISAATGSVVCAADQDTTYTAGAGLALDGTTLRLSSAGCAAGSVWKWSGSAWACSPDANTTYTAGSGIQIVGGAIGIATGSCFAGQVQKWTGSQWQCAADADTVYTAAPGGGLSLSAGNALSIAPGGVKMQHIDSPRGNQRTNTLAELASGSNYIFGGTAFTAPATGFCMVTSRAVLFDVTANDIGAGYLWLGSAREEDGTATNDGSGHYGFFHAPLNLAPHNRSSASTTWVWPVTEGKSYRFGCFLFTTSAYVGKPVSCAASYMCM